MSGMLNKSGGKVRLTFKLEMDQLWIGTKERTEKVPLNSIKNVVSEAIVGQEEYHIVALQLGPTEQSRYFIYWVILDSDWSILNHTNLIGCSRYLLSLWMLSKKRSWESGNFSKTYFFVMKM